MGTNVIMGGLVVLNDKLIVQPRDILYVIDVSSEDNDYNSKILFKTPGSTGTHWVKTTSTVADIISKFSGSVRL